MLEHSSVSERQACVLAGIYRSTYRYQSKLVEKDEALSCRIIELAQQRHRFGYRRIHPLLRREGHEVNHKKVYRLYTEASLAVKSRKRHKGLEVPREPLMIPTRRNEVWSMDFVMDTMAGGRRIKILYIVDDCTMESIDLVVDFGVSGHYATRVLDQAARFRGYPKAIRTDQEPEVYRQGTRSLGLQTRRAIKIDTGRKTNPECFHQIV